MSDRNPDRDCLNEHKLEAGLERHSPEDWFDEEPEEEEMTSKTLEELQAENLPRFNWKEAFTVTGDISEEDKAKLSEYFSIFVDAVDGECISCGASTGGLLGRFTYGLAHGEGSCGKCGYPARANHYDIGPIGSLTLILQYHPSELTKKEPEPVLQTENF